jgi:FtsZ-binding cell division protein ZapB
VPYGSHIFKKFEAKCCRNVEKIKLKKKSGEELRKKKKREKKKEKDERNGK